MATQNTDSALNGIILALSGGLQDAYTYNVRGNVFANAQTGNIVLMSQCLMSGQFTQVVEYIIPLVAFCGGVFCAEQIHHKVTEENNLTHRKQFVLVIEIFVLAIVGFIPDTMNTLANALVSFSCALQVQTFRTVNGYGFASTMCIGNLRSGTEALSVYFRENDKKSFKVAGLYFKIILFFAIGAGAGGILSLQNGLKTIWISCALLFLSLLTMLKK